MDRSASYQTLPISSEPLNGVLSIQDIKKPMSSWEFCVGGSKRCLKYGVSIKELDKLSGYPITYGDFPGGIEVTLEYEGKPYPVAAFHGYDEYARGGKHFYIGSRGQMGRKFTELYREFLTEFGVGVGVGTDSIPVKLDFKADNIVAVSRRQLTE